MYKLSEFERSPVRLLEDMTGLIFRIYFRWHILTYPLGAVSNLFMK